MQIIVLGMHRSGTSAVARLLNLMGAYFGGENISTGASAENEKGFWERLDVRALNDSMLHNANCDWDRIAELDLNAIPEDFRNAYHRSARDIVLNLDAHRPWFIKEPRLCILLPVWRPALELPFCVHVFRHPVEVAHSLKARNGIPIRAGLALWEAYNANAIESSADLPRFFLSYSELLSSPQPVVNQLRDAMSSSSGYEFRTPSITELAGALDGSLRHQRHEDDGGNGSPSKSQLALYEVLADARDNGAFVAPPLSRSSLNTLRRFESSGEHLAARMRRSNARQRANVDDPRLALKSMELDQALKAVSEKSTAVTNAAKTNAKLTEALSKQNTDLALKNDAIKRLTADVDNRRNVLAKRDQTIQSLTVELETRAAALAAQEKAVAGLNTQITQYKSALDARDAEIKELGREVAALSAASEGKEDSLKGLSAELADVQAASVAKDDSLARLQAELADVRAASTAKDGSFAQLQAELTGVQAAVATKDDALKGLQSELADVQAALATKDDAWVQLKVELADARAASTAKDGALAQLQAELADLRAAAATTNDSLVQQQAELADARSAVAAKDDSLARLQAELAEAKAAAIANGDSLARSEAELAEMKAQLTAKDDRLARMATEAADYQTELTAKAEAAEILSAEVQEYETRAAINNEAIKRLTADAEQRQQETSAMEHTVRRLTAESRHLRSELDARNQLLAAGSVTATRLRDELSQLRNRTERAVKRITDESVKIADENRKLKRRGDLEAGNAARLQAEVDALRDRHRDLTTAVDAVLRSRRWRVGNFLLSLRYRLLFRRVPPMATDTIKRISEIEDRP
ncbi:MAG: hypothetical protein OXQ90_11225 [Gammaproteobacteria bacterium]|nr:hypothetical protein [Gammaproteobacteria bacterium]